MVLPGLESMFQAETSCPPCSGLCSGHSLRGNFASSPLKLSHPENKMYLGLNSPRLCILWEILMIRSLIKCTSREFSPKISLTSSLQHRALQSVAVHSGYLGHGTRGLHCALGLSRSAPSRLCKNPLVVLG